ncbi:MAG: efflux RND transporter periplasmic adaptor subunit, partial [Woeseiaceae bacterium]
MKNCNLFGLTGVALLTTLALLAAACSDRPESAMIDSHEDLAADFERGPHNGRLLRDGDFSLEVTIFETGVPPEFRVYPYRNGQPVAPDTVDLTIELGRLGNKVDRFSFSPQGDALRGAGIVVEPHSFAVSVSARHAGKQFQWQYDSYEGRTQIEPVVAQAMGIEVATAGSGTIRETIELQGSVQPHPDAITEVRGRFPGIVQSLQKSVGDSVRQGEALATVLSNESLQTYTVASPRNGTVIARDATIGSSSSGNALYVVADMSRLVADLKVYARDLERIAVGQSVDISSLDGTTTISGRIERILPTLDSNSRAATVRTLLTDAGSAWRPGQFVQGVVVVAEHDVPLVVRESGLQSFRDFTVVYARVG